MKDFGWIVVFLFVTNGVLDRLFAKLEAANSSALVALSIALLMIGMELRELVLHLKGKTNTATTTDTTMDQ